MDDIETFIEDCIERIDQAEYCIPADLDLVQEFVEAVAIEAGNRRLTSADPQHVLLLKNGALIYDEDMILLCAGRIVFFVELGSPKKFKFSGSWKNVKISLKAFTNFMRKNPPRSSS